MPFFSIIIPTYNRAALLKEALGSIAVQECKDFEVVVVDDGSTDDTETVVRSSGLTVRFLRQANAGPGAARNFGIREASGRYIVFLDSDDKWFPWTLRLFQQAIVSEGEPTFLAGFGASQNGEDERYNEACVKLERYGKMLDACADRTPPVGGTPSVCVAKSALSQIGGFVDQRINGEDTDLWLRLGSSPGFVRILSPPVFWQRMHAASVTHQLQPAIDGAWYLLRQEQQQHYPGGEGYSRRRRRIICGTVRSVSLDCLGDGRVGEAFRLYWASLVWNMGLGNLKYVAGFPLAACRLGRR